MKSYAVLFRNHRCKIWSTNSLVQVNKQIQCRTNVVGLFPNDDALLRLVGAILAEQNDELQASGRSRLTMIGAVILDVNEPNTPEAIHHGTDC